MSMRCPTCGYARSTVKETRERNEGNVLIRRRECVDCGHRFTTVERPESVHGLRISRDQRERRQHYMRMYRAARWKPPVNKLREAARLHMRGNQFGYEEER